MFFCVVLWCPLLRIPSCWATSSWRCPARPGYCHRSTWSRVSQRAQKCGSWRPWEPFSWPRRGADHRSPGTESTLPRWRCSETAAAASRDRSCGRRERAPHGRPPTRNRPSQGETAPQARGTWPVRPVLTSRQVVCKWDAQCRRSPPAGGRRRGSRRAPSYLAPPQTPR